METAASGSERRRGWIRFTGREGGLRGSGPAQRSGTMRRFSTGVACLVAGAGQAAQHGEKKQCGFMGKKKKKKD